MQPFWYGAHESSFIEREKLHLADCKISNRTCHCFFRQSQCPNVYLAGLKKVFDKLGYTVTSSRPILPEEKQTAAAVAPIMANFGFDYGPSAIMDQSVTMEYAGKGKRENDLTKYFRFVSLDPKTGKLRSFYYPVPEPKAWDWFIYFAAAVRPLLTNH